MAIPFNPFFQYTDSNGEPLLNGRLRFLDPSTSSEKAIYTDYTGGTELTNPVLLESDSRVAGNGVFLGSGYYTVQVQEFTGNDEFGNPQYSTIEEIEYVEGAVTGVTSNSAVYSTWSALKSATSGVFDYVRIMGRLVAGDGGGGWMVWNALSTASDNGGTILAPDDAPSEGRYIRESDCSVNVAWFIGPMGGASPVDSGLVSANTYATDNGFSLSFPSGEYPIASSKTFTAPSKLATGAFFNSSNSITVTFNYPIEAGPSKLVEGDVVLSVPNCECLVEWWDVTTSNLASVNATQLGTVTSLKKLIFSSGEYFSSAITLTNPIKVLGGSRLFLSGNSSLGGFEGGKNSLGISGSFTVSITNGQEINISWFDNDSTLNTVASVAHRACVSGNTLVWDLPSMNLSTYTQTVGRGNRIPDGCIVAIAGPVVLKSFSAGKLTLGITTGSLILENTTTVYPTWFSGMNPLGDALVVACASGCEIDGENVLYSRGGTALEPSANITFRRLNLTSTANSLYLSGAFKVKVFDSNIDSDGGTAVLVGNASAELEAVNTSIIGDYSISVGSGKVSKLIGCYLEADTAHEFKNTYNAHGNYIKGGEAILRTNSFMSSNTWECVKISFLSVSNIIGPCSMSGDTVICSSASSVETGYLEINGGLGSTTVVRGLNLDSLNFVGSADASFSVIKKAGTFSTTPTDHIYSSIGHVVSDADMVALVTDKKYVVSKTIESLGNALHSIELSETNGLLTFGADEESVWSGVFGFSYGDADPQIRKDVAVNTVSFVGYWTDTSPTPPYTAEWNIHLSRIQ